MTEKPALEGRFHEFALRFGITIPQVEEVYNEIMKKIMGVGSKNIPDNYKAVADVRTQLALANKYLPKIDTTVTPRKEAEELEGFLIGRGEFRDKAGEIWATVARNLEKNKSWLLEKGYIDRDGTVLDPREKKFGRINLNYGKPVDKKHHEYEMTLYGMFHRKDDPVLIFSTFQTTNNDLASAWGKIPFPGKAFQPCKTFGNVKETPLGLQVSSSTAEKTRTLFRKVDADWNVEKSLRQGIFSLSYTPDQVYEHYCANANNFNRIVFVEGMITDIRPDWANFRGTPAWLIDKNDVANRVKIQIPDYWSINFGDYTEAIVFGKDREIMRKNQETGKYDAHSEQCEIQCYGIFPLPGHVTQPSRDLSKTENLEGFLE